MMPNKKRGFLQLVWDSVADNDLKSFIPSLQMDLFVHRDKNSVLFIYFSDIDKESFSAAIKKTNPLYIIDMRLNPRFDIPGYSRKIAFTEFGNIGATYMDYLELFGATERDKSQLINAIDNEIFNKLEQGSLAFIFGDKKHDAIYETELIHKLPKTKHKWNLSIVPN